MKNQTSLRSTVVRHLTFTVDTTINGLWKFNIVKRYLVMVIMVMGFDASQNRQEGESREDL